MVHGAGVRAAAGGDRQDLGLAAREVMRVRLPQPVRPVVP